MQILGVGMKYTKSLNLLMLVFCGFAQNVMGCEPQLWGKIGQTSIYIAQGDITKLQNVDAIVNAANENLQHWGGIAGAISKASSELDGHFPKEKNKDEALLTKLQIHSDAMSNYSGFDVKCPVGQAVITPAFGLVKNGVQCIIHAVGPRGENAERESLLSSTYGNTCRIALDAGMKSIAFCAISTNIFGYDIKEATPVAFKAISGFISDNPDKVLDKIIFVLFNQNDFAVYKNNSKILLDATPESSGVASSHDQTENIAEKIESAKKEENTRPSFSFKKLFYAAIPVSLLGWIIWHFWQTKMN